MTNYIIGAPVSELPPTTWSAPETENDWSLAYIAARKANGQWVPVDCETRSEAKKLNDVAKKQGLEAVIRRHVCYLRVRV